MSRMLDAAFGSQWAITEEKLRDLEFILSARAEDVRFTADEIRTHLALSGHAERSERKVRQQEGCAIIPVFGVLSKRANLMTEVSGGTSTEILAADIDRAAADPSVTSIILDIASPGGEVKGTTAAAAAVARARAVKPIIAVANEEMCSGAYWIASQATEIVTAPLATIGSIGVYTMVRERKEADERAGIRTEIIRSGRFKAAGNPYEHVSDDQRAEMQAYIDSIFAEFIAAVASGRRVSIERASEWADGRVWIGKNAVAIGLADRVGSLEDVVAERSAGRARRSNVMADNVTGSAAPEPTQPVVSQSIPQTLGAPTVVVPAAAGAAIVPPTSSTAVAGRDEREIRAEERNRVCEIQSAAAALWQHDPARGEQVAQELIAADLSLEAAQAEMARRLSKERRPIPVVPATISPDGSRLTGTDAPMDRIGSMASDALVFRMTGQMPQTSANQQPQRAREIQRMRHLSLSELGRECLRAAGVPDVSYLPKQQVASLCLDWERAGLPRAFSPRSEWYGDVGASFQTSGEFPNILRDATNKTLLMSFRMNPGTWRQWVRVAESVDDLKPINRVRLSEFPTLEIIPEDRPYPNQKQSDQRETYTLDKRGMGWGLSWEAMVNDDLDAFSRNNTKMGRAAENTLNRSIYALLTGNQTMADGDALFHANHANLISSGNGAPSVGQLAIMRRFLRLQTALQATNDGRTNQNIMGLNLRHLIVPAQLETAGELVVNSVANPDTASASSEDAARAARNSGTYNPFYRSVNLIVEPVLDASSTQIYYGACDNSECDTAEITFLRGKETPTVEEEYDFDTKGRKFTIDLVWGVRVVDHRGLVRNNG